VILVVKKGELSLYIRLGPKRGRLTTRMGGLFFKNELDIMFATPVIDTKRLSGRVKGALSSPSVNRNREIVLRTPRIRGSKGVKWRRIHKREYG